MSRARSFAACLDAISKATTPTQEWLHSLDFDALKAKWAREEAAETTEYLNELARRSGERVRTILGE